MGTGEIRVTTNRLENDAEKLASLISSMETQLENMKASINQLNQMWEGNAKTAFMTAFEDDRRAAEGVLKELKSLQNYEAQAKTKYENCEKQIENLVNSIRV